MIKIKNLNIPGLLASEQICEDHSRMARRAMMSTNVHGRRGECADNAAQIQNIVVQSRRRTEEQSSCANSRQRTKQAKMVHTDYTRGSDSEDSD